MAVSLRPRIPAHVTIHRLPGAARPTILFWRQLFCTFAHIDGEEKAFLQRPCRFAVANVGQNKRYVRWPTQVWTIPTIFLKIRGAGARVAI